MERAAALDGAWIVSAIPMKSDNPYFQPEMLDIYPQQVVRSGIQDVWQQRPVSLEVCGTVSEWKRDHFDVNYILEQALRWHVTSVNFKSSPIPAELETHFEDLPEKDRIPLLVAAPRISEDSRGWINDADSHVVAERRRSASVLNYPLAVQMRSREDSTVINVPVDVRKWLPGDAVLTEVFIVPENLREGTYDFRVAMLDPRTENPSCALQLKDGIPTAGTPKGKFE